MVNVRIKEGLLVRLKIVVKTLNGSWGIIKINIISVHHYKFSYRYYSIITILNIAYYNIITDVLISVLRK